MSSPKADRTGGIGPFAVGTIVLALIVLALTGLTRACSVSAPGAVDRASVPRIDVAEATRSASGSLPFRVRGPAMPADWIPQSTDTRGVPGGEAFRLGWLTPDDAFARLVQSNGTPEGLVSSEGGAPQAGEPVSAGGLTWATYRGERNEPIWVSDVGGVRWLVTGNASPARFVQLITTAQQSP
ncbi:DUF4245 domain-containing protein [Actinomycetospora termitidis]|uniref:DUF4245 domain-containing protein n=1 Tax=Actinomycetospora termitidis TaxID=3053470 RepID=A0ABT7M9U0_9PSEU|nr:DUF4245 domain-containing protein [Actinomycetospora sp. Odt1-22]MDL5157429.1 DUF4245 domain-containing protein [Actinomycetospora sp. Odt1-22]